MGSSVEPFPAICHSDSVRSELAGSRSLAIGGVTRRERREFKFRRRNLEGAEGPFSGRSAFDENGVRRAAAALSGEGRDSAPPEPVSRSDPFPFQSTSTQGEMRTFTPRAEELCV